MDKSDEKAKRSLLDKLTDNYLKTGPAQNTRSKSKRLRELQDAVNALAGSKTKRHKQQRPSSVDISLFHPSASSTPRPPRPHSTDPVVLDCEPVGPLPNQHTRPSRRFYCEYLSSQVQQIEDQIKTAKDQQEETLQEWHTLSEHTYCSEPSTADITDLELSEQIGQLEQATDLTDLIRELEGIHTEVRQLHSSYNSR